MCRAQRWSGWVCTMSLCSLPLGHWQWTRRGYSGSKLTFSRNLDWDQETHDVLFWLQDLIFIFSDNVMRAMHAHLRAQRRKSNSQRKWRSLQSGREHSNRSPERLPGASWWQSSSAHHFQETPLCPCHRVPQPSPSLLQLFVCKHTHTNMKQKGQKKPPNH